MLLYRGCLPWQKLTQEIAKLTHACRQTVAGLLFVFVDYGAGIRSATYLCLDCAKNVDRNWNITASFIIHVNFDHAWTEHYPVTLNAGAWGDHIAVQGLADMLHIDIHIISTISPDMELIRTSHNAPAGVIHLGLIRQFHYQALQKIDEHHPACNQVSANGQSESLTEEHDKEFY